ncbi:hypothetical protein [Lacticaseibacillus rhamnosus]|uniref:hypothetical protein n=1 Tax=Lacticaseibacillus rhamnosus TaxID=47715 RepID=UPI000408A595|nr:hypothetical protein [Lacticaseibacillus rhamnosus]
MRKRLVILGLILLSFVGLYALLTSYQSATTTTAKETAKEYKVVRQKDLVLSGVVRAEEIKVLDSTSPENVKIKNGEHITKGQVIYQTGYTTPISGTFIVKEDGSYAVVSDAKYIDASVTELDRHLISQGVQVKVANIDGSKKYDCVVKKVDVLPSSEESITKYRLQVPIQGVNVGVHMNINIPYSSVLIPGKFEDKGQILIKKSNSKAFKKRKINIIRTMGLKYASIAEVPVGSVLKEVAK